MLVLMALQLLFQDINENKLLMKLNLHYLTEITLDLLFIFFILKF